MKNKTAIVTGGAKGIGRSISHTLAQDGWDLILCGRDSKALDITKTELEGSFKTKVGCIQVDLSEPGSVAHVFQKCQAELGEMPQALVCNASNYGPLGSFHQVEFEKWKQSFNLNFFSIAEMIQGFVQQIKSRPQKSENEPNKKIVVMSGGGLGGAKVWPGASAYLTAKAALYYLVEATHQETRHLPLDINCVAPGAVKTGMTEQAVKAGREAISELYDAQLKVYQGAGDPPQNAARMISALLHPLSDGISGRLISAKWDKEVLEKNTTFKETLTQDVDLFRLRRIDNKLFSKSE